MRLDKVSLDTITGRFRQRASLVLPNIISDKSNLLRAFLLADLTDTITVRIAVTGLGDQNREPEIIF